MVDTRDRLRPQVQTWLEPIADGLDEPSATSSLAPNASEDYSELTDLAGLADPTLAILFINV